LAICAIGTWIHGAHFPVWTFIADNYLQLLTCSTLLSLLISVYVYACSFTVRRGNPDLRELAVGGQTGNIVYDFFIGRELNPRVKIPLLGVIDIKSFLAMRPGLTGWVLLDLAFMAKQYRLHGFVSDSMLLTTAVQMYYILEGQYFEDGLLRMMDIITDGLGFMLTFGDIVLVPFLYSTQTRYLAVHPVQLGLYHTVTLALVFAAGLYIFRASNAQRLRFRTEPDHPSVKDLSYIQTKRGTRLLTGGWWGLSRHMNYLGDWIQAIPFSATTGVAGYLIIPSGDAVQKPEAAVQMLDGRVVVQGDARGWGMIFTYCYVAWFATLLIHREGRDDKACAEKYGDDWRRYKQIVRWRILPGVY
jgi:Delta14-sterol reductase